MKNLAAIILAAGRSSRFGSDDKLLADIRGRGVLERVLDTVTGLGLAQVVVVTRPDFAGLADLGRDPRLTCVMNSRPDDGMGSSLALGVAALQACEGVFVVLGDMPWLPPALFAVLAPCLHSHDIAVPEHDGRPGHPVLFARACFAALLTLTGDRGARSLVDSGSYRVARVASDNALILADIDTPDDLQQDDVR